MAEPDAHRMEQVRKARGRAAREQQEMAQAHRYGGLIEPETMADEQQRRAWVGAVVAAARMHGFTGRIRFIRLGGVSPFTEGKTRYGVEIHRTPGCCSASANRD